MRGFCAACLLLTAQALAAAELDFTGPQFQCDTGSFSDVPFDTETCIESCEPCFGAPEWDALKQEVGLRTDARDRGLEGPMITVGFGTWASAFMSAQALTILIDEMMGYRVKAAVMNDPMRALQCVAATKVDIFPEMFFFNSRKKKAGLSPHDVQAKPSGVVGLSGLYLPEHGT